MIKRNNIDVITSNVVIAVDKRFKDNVPQEFRNYLYLAATGLCLSLGSSYVDDIFNVINKISYTKGIKFYTDKNYLVLSNFDADLSINYQFYVKNLDYLNINTLEFIIREIINLLFMNNTIVSANDKLITNVFKNLEVEDIIDTIDSIKDNEYSDEKFSAAINYFKGFKIDEYSCNGYENIVNLFKPLYKFTFLKELFIKGLADGNYQDIYKEFNSILGDNSFEKMISSLIAINNKLNRKNIPTYDIACSYLNIRNKFVQSYINLKFSEI